MQGIIVSLQNKRFDLVPRHDDAMLSGFADDSFQSFGMTWYSFDITREKLYRELLSDKLSADPFMEWSRGGVVGFATMGLKRACVLGGVGALLGE